MDADQSSVPAPAPADRPLSEGQLEELAAATAKARKLLGAARAAAITGWTVGAAGVLSLLLGLLDPVGLLTGVALVAVAWNELEGRKMLLRFQPGGPRRLARNQLWLLAVIVAYCGLAVYRAHAQPDPELSQLETVLGLAPGFVAEATSAIYLVILLVGTAFQWGMYRYHAARIPLLAEYVSKTPRWVLEVQRIVRGGRSGPGGR